MKLDVYLNQAIAHQNKGEFLQAIAILESARTQYGENSDLLYVLAGCCSNYASYLARRRDIEGAFLYYNKAISFRPDLPNLYYNFGDFYKTLGNNYEAIVQYLKAVERSPEHELALFCTAEMFRATRQWEAAEKFYLRALQFNSNPCDVYNNFGLLYLDQGKYEPALGYFQKALDIDRNYNHAIVNKAYVLGKLVRYAEAVEHCKVALMHDPEDILVLCALIGIYCSQGRSDLTNEIYIRIFKRKILNQHAVSLVLMNILYCNTMNPQSVYSYHRTLAEVAFPIKADLSLSRVKGNKQILRIGFVSPDFRTHSVSYFFEPILDAYDKKRYHITCYSNGTLDDYITLRLKEKSDHWVDISGLSDEAVAKRISNDDIDILVDLAGHTVANRLSVFAYRPAPVQVTYLGYPATTGLPVIDYRITDSYSDPIGLTESLHTEQLVRLPGSMWCYRPSDMALPLVPSLTRRGYITFGSFNALAKHNVEIVDVWAKILTSVPCSRLIIKNSAIGDSETRRYFSYLFKKKGIAADRIDFIGLINNSQEHMLLYNDIDIALDTFPYNGTTTTFEALWMGVPVITLAGTSHASRVGVSILSNLGLPELIARDVSDYIDIAVQLAADSEHLEKMKKSLRVKMLASCLVDSVSFTRDLEDAFELMWSTTK